jgi:hypothetical protein
MYLSDDANLGESKRWVDRRYRLAGLGAFGVPVMDVQCADPPGCAPVGAAGCGAAIREAVRDAIKLANNAADKLEALVLEALVGVPVASRDADAKRTASRFIRYFGHDPLRPVTWAGNEESAVSVAKRFRAVANELNGGRRVIFHCWPTTADCAENAVTQASHHRLVSRGPAKHRQPV